MGLRSLHTSIFIKTPSLEGLPTKAKEIPLPMRWDYLLPDINPVFPGLWDILYYYYCYYYYYYYYYFIIIIIMFFEMEYYSLKEKVITILNNSVSQFSIESKKIPPPHVVHIFLRIDNSWSWKPLPGGKLLDGPLDWPEPIKNSDTLFFRAMPYFTNPWIFMVAFWIPFLGMKTHPNIKVGGWTM